MRFNLFILATVAWFGMDLSVVNANALTCEHSTQNVLSCKDPVINCNRFDYNSITRFSKSVILYAELWHLKSPQSALSNLTTHDRFDSSIDSIDAVQLFFEQNPETIYIFGQYVERENKPKEWLFVAEQAFIRSWNSLLRNTSE